MWRLVEYHSPDPFHLAHKKALWGSTPAIPKLLHPPLLASLFLRQRWRDLDLFEDRRPGRSGWRSSKFPSKLWLANPLRRFLNRWQVRTSTTIIPRSAHIRRIRQPSGSPRSSLRTSAGIEMSQGSASCMVQLGVTGRGERWQETAERLRGERRDLCSVAVMARDRGKTKQTKEGGRKTAIQVAVSSLVVIRNTSI